MNYASLKYLFGGCFSHVNLWCKQLRLIKRMHNWDFWLINRDVVITTLNRDCHRESNISDIPNLLLPCKTVQVSLKISAIQTFKITLQSSKENNAIMTQKKQSEKKKLRFYFVTTLSFKHKFWNNYLGSIKIYVYFSTFCL